ncbi:MAG: methyl-accepting chemotaxis protein [Zoogloea sp.]|nr:methyl-accepting chemotaxis protein [Zoogloea sp.]MCA0185925.1 methyl-accepting chemotaxis protein [Pseudomonadota bacterium]
MTITKRLRILLITMMLALVAVGTMGVVQMRTLAGHTAFLNANIIPSVVEIDKLAKEFAILRSMVLRHFLSDDDKQMTAFEDDIRKQKELLNKTIQHYADNLISDDTDKALILAGQAKLKEFMAMIDEPIALSRAQQVDKAKAIYEKHRPQITATTAALDEHIAYNLKLADEYANTRASETFQTGLWLLVGTILTAIAIGLYLGIGTYRQVVGALSGIKTTVGEIAETLDFTRRVDAKAQDEVGDTGRALNTLLDQVQSSLQQFRSQTDQVSDAASRLASAAKQVATGSDDQSEASASMAAAIEELTVSINHVSDRSNEANTLVTQAGAAARNGSDVIDQTLGDIRNIEAAVKDAAEIVGRLDASSAKVNAVVTVIKEVADQTNLLALNAAIEAARAGEQGRGFAVVADEVRKLAERTAQSTHEISSTMASMQSDATSAVKGMLAAVDQVNKGVEHTREAEMAVREIESGSTQTIGMVSEISEAIREQSSASAIIAQKVERIAQMSEENSAAAGTTSSTASDLNTLAAAMRQEVQKYRV